MRRGARMRGVPGQVAIAFAGALLVLVAFAGLSVDAIGAWSMHQAQIDYLQGIQELVMGAEEPIKYCVQSDRYASSVNTAYEFIRRHVLETSENKHAFATKVTIYELPKEKTGPADRYIGIKVEVRGEYETTFASVLGFSKIPVESNLETVVHPYAETEVYRPTADASSLEVDLSWKRLPDGTRWLEETQISRNLDWDALDEDLKAALTEAAGIN